MNRKRSIPNHLEPIPDRAREFLGVFAVGAEVGTFDLSPDQFELCRRSPAYRALLRSSVENPAIGAMHALDVIWERSGRPEGKSPRQWLAEPDRGVADETIEDRGADGIFADWESATWYVHYLDPVNFGIDQVLDQLY